MGNEATKKKDNLREDLLQSEINGHSIKGLKKKEVREYIKTLLSYNESNPNSSAFCTRN